MRLIARRIRSRVAEEVGVTLIIALGVMTVTLALTVAAFTAMNVDVHTTSNDLLQKRAMNAAQAGLQWFSFKVDSNVNYWTTCPTAVHTQVPNTTDESFSFKVLPASSEPNGDYIGGQPACNASDPIGSVIESATGPNPGAADSFRVEFNGYATGVSNGVASDSQYNKLNNGWGVERTLVATFYRTGFLNFVYYTVDEQSYGSNTPIEFVTGDTVNGPLHSEDTIHISGNPVFGRANHTPVDVVQVKGVSIDQNGSSPTYNTANNTYDTTKEGIQPPPDNSQLKQIAGASYTGQSFFVLSASTYCVTNANFNNGVQQCNIPYPANGVIYVSSSSCGVTLNVSQVTYPGTPGCGDAFVDGTYSTSLTIAADNDIIIDGSITTNLNGSALLGLIGNNWVRIKHPCYPQGSNQSGSLTNPTIDAAILAVNRSFQVDNYDCGASLGTLTVNGAIAQQYRGTVGTFGGGGTGYLKGYSYDDRLLAEEPPYFLNPINAAWAVGRETECSALDTGNCSN